MLNNENPVVIVKRKQINALNDFCLDHRIAFRLTPRGIQQDEWDVEFEVKDPTRAILLGMFLREHRLELNGTPYLSNKPQVERKKKKEENIPTKPFTQEQAALSPPASKPTPDIPNSEISSENQQEYESEEAPFSLPFQNPIKGFDLFADDQK